MHEVIIDMAVDLAMLKTALGKMIKVGPVAVVDAEKGYRIRLGGTDDEPFLSPWRPHPETGKTSVPLKEGQIVGLLNPSGDPRQGLLLRGGYSDAHSSPNGDMAANVFEDAGVKVTVAAGKLTAVVGGVSMILSPEGVDFNGGHVRHNGKLIDDTHTHGGVFTGFDSTDVPN